MSHIHYRHYKGILLLARDLRNNPTSSEKILWEVLRRKKTSGYRFLRQHPIFIRIDNDWVDFYIADFYCAELQVVIELDGKIHDTRKEYDQERDEKMLSRGIRVLRIKNEELENIENVVVKIKKFIAN